MFEVFVSKLYFDPESNQPVVWLKESKGDRVLPIWIGFAEAYAIDLELGKKSLNRPLAHDLIKTTLDLLNVKLTKVVISDLRAGSDGVRTYYAELFLQSRRNIIRIDARPSDSIVLALKAKAPIFVTEKVMELQSGRSEKSEEEKIQSLRERLQRIDPADFGNFTL